MKKKEIFINFILAILITCGSWFYVSRLFTLDASIVKRGWPLSYWSHTTAGFDFGQGYIPTFPSHLNLFSIVIDFFFWFLILSVGWWLVKKFKNNGSKVFSQLTGPNQNLLMTIIISVLLTGILTGLIVFFWQKSENEKVINSLKQKIILLEKQISKMQKDVRELPQVNISPTIISKPQKSQNGQKSSPLPTPSLIKGASLSEIKYTLPEGWKAELRTELNDLFFTPKEHEGYLAIKVYPYDGKTGRRKYYCQLTGFCTKYTYFTPLRLGNISGYQANALDNSGGGSEYFGAKGDKFYIISSFSPSYPPVTFFDKTYKEVLNSLVF